MVFYCVRGDMDDYYVEKLKEFRKGYGLMIFTIRMETNEVSGLLH